MEELLMLKNLNLLIEDSYCVSVGNEVDDKSLMYIKLCRVLYDTACRDMCFPLFFPADNTDALSEENFYEPLDYDLFTKFTGSCEHNIFKKFSALSYKTVLLTKMLPDKL